MPLAVCWRCPVSVAISFSARDQGPSLSLSRWSWASHSSVFLYYHLLVFRYPGSAEIGCLVAVSAVIDVISAKHEKALEMVLAQRRWGKLISLKSFANTNHGGMLKDFSPPKVFFSQNRLVNTFLNVPTHQTLSMASAVHFSCAVTTYLGTKKRLRRQYLIEKHTQQFSNKGLVYISIWRQSTNTIKGTRSLSHKDHDTVDWCS